LLKLDENPPIRSPLAPSLNDLVGRWWVGHTKPRCEKAFAWDLHDSGIAYFLPMIERVRMSGGRKRRVMMPLFPSYVFFCGSDEDRYAALLTDRLCQTIEVKNSDQLVAELDYFDRALASDATFDPYPYAVVGQRCRVTAGPFEGIVGTVIRRDGVANPRLVLQVSLLGQGAAMEIDADLLEPLSEES
jgi:hypothetical protein